MTRTPDLVVIPRDVVERALRKARTEYVRGCEEDGQDPGPDWECWFEFQALADYVER